MNQSFAQNLPFSKDGFELARLDYTLFPSLGEVQLEKTNFSLGIGKKLNKGLLAFNIGYTRYDLFFKESPSAILLADFEDLHSVRFNIIYGRFLKNNWAINAMISPMLSSNFEGNLTTEDFVYTSFLSATKSWPKGNLTSKLTFGAAFGTLFGRPRLFPLISYSKELSPTMRYSLGLPVTGFFYDVNDKSTLNVTIRPEGFFANNSIPLMLDNGQQITDSKLQFNGLKLALGYRLKFNNNWRAQFNLGYLPVNTMEIIDNDNNTIYDIETDETIFINIALSFNLKKKQNEN